MRDHKFGDPCQRCGKKSSVMMMSMFSTQMCCMDCIDRERKSPRYEEARKADEAAIRSGDFNYRGIGGQP